MSNKLKIMLALIILLSGVTAVSAESPNSIVLILTDDFGWEDTTLYGKTSLYETPNNKRLTARGMTFTSAYAIKLFDWSLSGVYKGTKLDPRFRVHYANPKPLPYPAPTQRAE